MNRGSIIGVVVAAMATLTVGALGYKALAGKVTIPVNAAAAAVAKVPAPVTTTTAKPSYVGVLLPPQMANVASRADGKLIAVPVKVGQPVRKGDLLAQFDARDRAADLAAAEANLKQAQGAAVSASADMIAARHRAARRAATVDLGNGQRVALVSQEEQKQAAFDATSAAGRAASASGQIAEQRAKIAQLKVALEETELRAPFDGVVTAVYFEAGMNAHANETIVRVVGGGRGLRVRVAIPEEDAAAARGAQRARLELDGQRTLNAVVDRIAPEVEPSSRTFLLEGTVEVDQACNDCVLLAGRTVRATFTR